MLGSLTVLPALLSRLGDKVDRGRVPLVGRLRRDDGEGRIWGAIVDRVLRRPVAVGRPRRRPARRPRDSRAPAPDGAAGPRHVPEVPSRRAVLRPHAGGLPGHGPAGQRGRQGPGRERPDDAGRHRAAPGAGARDRPHARADHGRRQRRRHGGQHHDPDRGQGSRLGLQRLAGRAPRRDRAEHGWRRSGRRGRRHGPHRPVEGQLRRDHVEAAAGRRVRARASPSRSCSSPSGRP